MTEQQILKKFKELGYVFREHNHLFIIESSIHKVRIWIDKQDKNYWAGMDEIDMKVHQLLNELFTVWGWFDEN